MNKPLEFTVAPDGAAPRTFVFQTDEYGASITDKESGHNVILDYNGTRLLGICGREGSEDMIRFEDKVSPSVKATSRPPVFRNKDGTFRQPLTVATFFYEGSARRIVVTEDAEDYLRGFYVDDTNEPLVNSFRTFKQSKVVGLTISKE